MSARGIARVLLVLLASPLAACSLVKLSDDVTQGHCERDADCNELNADPKFGDDPCQRWQCNTEEKLCRYGALDADHDQQTPPKVMAGGKLVTCEKDPAQQDCDDADETVGAGFDEVCDEKDNDCDRRVDEGALHASSSRAVVLESARAFTGATDAAFARDPMSGEVALAYGLIENTKDVPGASLLDPELADRSSAATLTVEKIATPFANQVAIAPLDGGRFAYAFVNQLGTHSLAVAGVWRAGNQVGMLEEIATAGVHCLPDESCNDALSPALATQDSDVLLAYLRFNGDASTVGCGDLHGSDTTADVLVNLLSRPSGDERLHEQSVNALSLGQSSDLAAPALLSLPAIDSVAPSWLVAYADASGDVVIEQLRRDGKKIAVVAPNLIRIGGGAVRSSLRLASGSSADGRPMFGLVHQFGCGGKAHVLFDAWQLSDDGGELHAEQTIAAVTVGGAANESNPALVYSPARQLWLVSYRDPSGLRARAVADDGMPQGAEPYTLIASARSEGGGGEIDILPVPMASFDLDADFATIAHVLRSDETDPRAFEVAKLSCEESSQP